MTGILCEIVAYKHEYVAECKQKLPLREVKRMALDAGQTRPTRGFERALRERSTWSGCALIAEIKSSSPSKGIIHEDGEPAAIAMTCERSGAACISVLTDEKFFKGSLDRMGKIRAATALPLLRKDFIIDPYQVYEARWAGADAVLLIAACLDDCLLADLTEISALHNMDCLLEVHDETEMLRARRFNMGLIGINNRDLATFTTDLAVTERLACLAPDYALLVSESGISCAEDVRRVHAAGAHAVLVGEAIMRERDMAAKVRELAGAI